METKSELFLTDEEVAELSEIRTGRRGKTREELQIAWLRTSGIPFWVSARGRPRIARAAIEGRSTPSPSGADADEKPWVPRVLMEKKATK